MKKILFYDCASPFSYDSQTLNTRAIGGTEATVIRVAEALSTIHDITVAQAYRSEKDKNHGHLTMVRYVPLEYPVLHDYDVLICVRKIDERCKNFKGQTFVLCQNFDEDILEIGSFLKNTNGTLISVSNHLMRLNKELIPGIKHTCIYNPIDDDLIKDNTPRNKNKLVFFSSPHKGFFDTLYAFGLMRTIIPELTLYYSNPGYIHWPHQTPDNAINLGQLPFTEIIKHVREAFCVFYINRIFPETFGLIYAEANAVGTPVLAHDFGAAREILHPNNPVIDCNNLLQVRDTFLQWYFERSPIVEVVEKFKISNVMKHWIDLIEN